MSIDLWIALALTGAALAFWWKSPPAALADHTTVTQRLADRFSAMGYPVTQTTAPDGAEELRVSSKTRTITLRRYPGGAMFILAPGGIVEVHSESMARAVIIRELNR